MIDQHGRHCAEGETLSCEMKNTLSAVAVVAIDDDSKDTLIDEMKKERRSDVVARR